ncbi:MAG: hypothetical protein RR565_09785 [Erysipelothrix sp.]
MEEYYFEYTIESDKENFSIKLTKLGWDLLSKEEKNHLVSIVKGANNPPTKWKHRHFGWNPTEAVEKWQKAIKKLKEKKNAK